jgi:hypothetical protein
MIAVAIKLCPVSNFRIKFEFGFSLRLVSMVSNFTIETKGDTVCVPAHWTDVARFFFFNFGLHAVTVISDPGQDWHETAARVLLSLLIPFTGITRALGTIMQCARREESDLDAALRAQALCMLLPHTPDDRFSLTITFIFMGMFLTRV